MINTKGKKISHYTAFKIYLQQYNCCCLSHTLQRFTVFGDKLFILRTFWSWGYGRDFTKYKTFILWLNRKVLYHLMGQKMNWAGRKRNRCLGKKRSKGLLFAMNIAGLTFTERSSRDFVAFSMCDPWPWYINALYCSSRLEGTFWTLLPLKLEGRNKKKYWFKVCQMIW